MSLLLLPFLFFAAALGLNPPVADPAINLQSPSLSIFNASNLLNDDTKVPKCNGKVYGYDLDKDSCLDAWAKIPTDDDLFTFGTRSQGHFEAPLPIRYLSPDGKCCIDVNHAVRSIWDSATHLEISTAAKNLLDACVLRDPIGRGSRPIGGRLGGVGQNGGLSLFVRSYSANVECIEDQPFDDDGQCSKILDSLPVSSRKLVFARPRSEDPDPGTVIVPVGGKYIGDVSTGRCTATVDLLNADRETSSWHEIWAGAVAVNAMCVQKGRAGKSFVQGADGRLFVELARE